jgi:hypothetical protein
MMHGHEKSDHAIAAGKPTNKAERSAAELVERRAGTEGGSRCCDCSMKLASTPLSRAARRND